jgi:molybdopterin-guanine dinucleotide biosynthesis protein A
MDALSALLLIAIGSFAILGSIVEVKVKERTSRSSKSIVVLPDENPRTFIYIVTGVLALLFLFPGPLLGINTGLRLLGFLIIVALDAGFVIVRFLKK